MKPHTLNFRKARIFHLKIMVVVFVVSIAGVVITHDKDNNLVCEILFFLAFAFVSMCLWRLTKSKC